MPAERVSMKKIRDVLRLTYELKMSRRQVSAATGIGRTAVTDYVQRLGAAGLSWPLPDGLDDAALERRLYPPGVTAKGAGIGARLNLPHHDAAHRRHEGKAVDMVIAERIDAARVATPAGLKESPHHIKRLVESGELEHGQDNAEFLG